MGRAEYPRHRALTAGGVALMPPTGYTESSLTHRQVICHCWRKLLKISSMAFELANDNVSNQQKWDTFAGCQQILSLIRGRFQSLPHLVQYLPFARDH